MARWRYDAQPLLRYATAPEAPLYREIMEIFAEAAAGYASRLSPEDVHAALTARLKAGSGEPGDDMPSIAEVKERLGQLWRWGTCLKTLTLPGPPAWRATSGQPTSMTSRQEARRPQRLLPPSTRLCDEWVASRPSRCGMPRKCSASSSARCAPTSRRRADLRAVRGPARTVQEPDRECGIVHAEGEPAAGGTGPRRP